LNYYTNSIYRVYKDKLQKYSCNQFHYIGTYKQVETNSMTKNRGGNNDIEKWIEKNTAARLLYITAGLTLDNSNFYPHTIFVSFMWFSGKKSLLRICISVHILGTTVRNQNCVIDGIKIRLNSANVWYCSFRAHYLHSYLKIWRLNDSEPQIYSLSRMGVISGYSP
jgi:hypothetical protein